MSQLALLPPLGHRAGPYFEPLRRALDGAAELVPLDYPPADFDWQGPALLNRTAVWLAGQLAARGLSPALLGGVSLGGTVAWLLAEHLPPSRGLLLLAPGGLPVAGPRRRALLTLLEQSTAEAFAAEQLRLSSDEGHLPGLEALLRAALDVDLRDRMAASDLPVRLVWGEEDRVFGPRHRARMIAALPNHELHLLAGVGHHACREAPDVIAALARAALA